MSDHRLTLLMMAGLPGAGKSTLARALATELGWLVIDKDIIHTSMAHAGDESPELGLIAYHATFSLVEDLVRNQRKSVIVDTAGRHPLILERCQQIAQASGARLKIIRCIVPSQIRAERMSNRKALLSQWSSDNVSARQEAEWYAHLPESTLLLDASDPIASLLTKVVEHVIH